MAIPCYGADHSKNHGFYYYYPKKNPNCLTVLKWTGWIIRPTSTSRFKDKFNYNHGAMILWLILALSIWGGLWLYLWQYRISREDCVGGEVKVKEKPSHSRENPCHFTGQSPKLKTTSSFPICLTHTLVHVRRSADATFWAEPPEGTLWVGDELIATIRALMSISYQHL